MSVVASIRRLRDEFTAMPGLRLTEKQVQRLCDVDASTGVSALCALVSAGFLRALDDGSYARADIATGSGMGTTPGGMEPPWHRILCLVEFDADSDGSLTEASHAALSYAMTLAVRNKARVTALYLVRKLPATAAQQLPFLAQVAEQVRRRVLGQSVPGLIDVRVEPGSPNEDLLRAAHEVHADLIVIGRREGGATWLSQLREMLRDAPCHVLVVHPSGQAAVA
jgi:nucleotide-binding universal stress UspA family protein